MDGNSNNGKLQERKAFENANYIQVFLLFVVVFHFFDNITCGGVGTHD